MSVHAPTHSSTAPSAPKRGTARELYQRYDSVGEFQMRVSISTALGCAMASFHNACTRTRSSGWMAATQPQPAYRPASWPVEACHDSCGALNAPDASAFQTMAVDASTSDR